jgi:hypothetical protein
MGRKFLSLKGEQGDASIFLSMILALGVGTAVYYNMDKLNQTLKSSKVTGQKQKAETRNISGLSTATALMSFTGADPQSDDANSLPYIYPDPYLKGGTMIGTPRTAPTVPTWSFGDMNLVVNSPADGELTGTDFAAYVNGGSRPKLSQHSSIKFKKPIFDKDNQYHIVAYDAEVTSTSFDNQKLVSRATIPVPTPLDPKCILRSADGQTKFQPNAQMNLELIVSGVAVEAWVPASDKALLAPEGDVRFHQYVDLREKAFSVRQINNNVYPWRVTAPRPLVAVDGENDVTFVTYAYLRKVDVNSEKGVRCSFTYKVAPPAFCKLWTDKASVTPGQCVNISSEMAGPVQANSLEMSVRDPSGKRVAGLSQNGGNGTFCTPSSSNYSTGVKVPKEAEEEYASAVSALTHEQKMALWQALSQVTDNLQVLFDKKGDKNVILQTLSVNQHNELWSLGPAQLKDLDDVDFSDSITFTHLSKMSPEQMDKMNKLKEQDFKDRDSLSRVFLEDIEQLKTVNAAVLKSLASYNSLLLLAYVGQVIDAQTNASAAPMDYKIMASIKANDGTTNSCLVHVTAGTNKCPFFGSQFPNYTQQQNLTVISNGVEGRTSFNFAPSKPNWEVSGVATSPVSVEECPTGARCFAVDFGGNRTPFTIVANADAANCKATTILRQDLGCFAPNTRIRLGDGTSEKRISELADGDLVWNPIRQKAMAIQRLMIGPEKIPLWTVTSESGVVRVTAKHPFLTPTGIRSADELKAGDRLLGIKGEEKILSVMEDSHAPTDWVWNFEIVTDSKDPADHAILADGVVTGDLYLQERLGQAPKDKLSQLKP